MHARALRRRCAHLAFSLALVVPYQVSSAEAQGVHGAGQELAMRKGHQLFRDEFLPRDSDESDGLGPLHNEKSCLACHFQGGDGGAGPLANNVDILTVRSPEKELSKDEREAFRRRLVKLHPGFADGAHRTRSSIVLHRFSTNPDYEALREMLLGTAVPPDLSSRARAVYLRALERRREKAPPVEQLPEADGFTFLRSQRNTPALFGAGLIESIPDRVLRAEAEQQGRGNSPVSGRIARTADGRIGRFGWRGQTASLEDFVLGACANELGLKVPGHEQPVDPLDPDRKLKGHDLTREQCDNLVAFVAGLEPPQRIEPASPQQRLNVATGKSLFRSIGCAGCHRPELGGVEGIYTDLLLHDMGSGLADPLPAEPAMKKVRRAVSGFYGGGVIDVFTEVPTAVRQEWRTPPLWGVRDSAPYLHDGRARTLADAIVAHGGEAFASRQRYLALSTELRFRLITFLQSLGARPSDD